MPSVSGLQCVFISSTSEDLRDYRAVARSVILDMQWHPQMMEHFGASAQPTVQACLDVLQGCDLLLLLVAYRRGWVPREDQGGNGTDSITALELRHARARNIPVLIMMANDEWPGKLWEDDDAARQWITHFRAELNQPAEFFRWEDPGLAEATRFPDFRARVRAQLVRYQETLQRQAAPRRPVSKRDYALAVLPMFLRRAWDPDVSRDMHGVPVAWRDALHDTRRALVTGVWKDREGNTLGRCPPLGESPPGIRTLLLAVERALAYCVAHLDEVLRLLPPSLLPSPPPPPPPVESRELIEATWVRELGLDALRSASETEPYSVEDYVRAIRDSLNSRLFAPNSLRGPKSGEPPLPTEQDIARMNHEISQPGLDPFRRGRYTDMLAKLLFRRARGAHELLEAIGKWEEALALVKEADPALAALISRSIADTYARLSGDHVPDARSWYERAERAFKGLGYENDVRLTEARRLSLEDQPRKMKNRRSPRGGSRMRRAP